MLPLAGRSDELGFRVPRSLDGVVQSHTEQNSTVPHDSSTSARPAAQLAGRSFEIKRLSANHLPTREDPLFAPSMPHLPLLPDFSKHLGTGPVPLGNQEAAGACCQIPAANCHLNTRALESPPGYAS